MRCSWYKKSWWHDYYVSSKRKKQKGCLCSQWNWNAFSQSNYKQKHAFSHIIQKAVDNNLSEEKTETLTCDRWNYSQPTPSLHDTPHPTPPWPPHPTPPIHDPPHPSMTHPTSCPPDPFMTHPTPPLYDTTPCLHDPSHPCMTHTTPVWPTPPLHDPPRLYWGTPFGRHAALRLFHFFYFFHKCLNRQERSWFS